jgi:hypothetical protein
MSIHPSARIKRPPHRTRGVTPGISPRVSPGASPGTTPGNLPSSNPAGPLASQNTGPDASDADMAEDV